MLQRQVVMVLQSLAHSLALLLVSAELLGGVRYLVPGCRSCIRRLGRLQGKARLEAWRSQDARSLVVGGSWRGRWAQPGA